MSRAGDGAVRICLATSPGAESKKTAATVTKRIIIATSSGVSIIRSDV
jgi:hypothetical protein